MSIQVRIEAQYEHFITATETLQGLFGGVMAGMKGALKDMSDESKKSMEGHESAFEQLANVMKSNMSGVTGAVEGVKIAWAQLAVIFEAGHFLKETVDETIKMTVESQSLGRALGISATAASYLKVAIGDVHGTTDQYLNLTKGLDTQLKSNESAMQKFGLETRDSGGHLKDQQTLIMGAMESLRGYKEGTDRNIAAQVLFGKGVSVTSEMLNLNAETLDAAKEKADALGLAIGEDDVEASNKFRAAMGDLHDIMDAVTKAIGSALLPALNDLSEWFGESGPTAVSAIKIALDIIISLFRGLSFAVTAAGALVVAQFKNMMTAAHGFADVFTALVHGDFAGAKAAAMGTFSEIADNVGTALGSIMDKATSTRDSLASMWGGVIDGPTVKDSGVEGGGTGDADITKTKKVKTPRDHSAADARKEAKDKYDAKMEGFRGEEEAAKGQFGKILEIQRKELAAAIAMYGEKSKQAEKAANRIAETERQAADQQVRLDEMRAQSARELSLTRIDIDQSDAEAREQMGQITIGELLTQERGFEEQRYGIQMQGLLDEEAANAMRVEDHQQTLNRIAALELQHQANVANINRQAAQSAAQKQEQQAQMLAGTFSNVVDGMINKTMSYKQAMAAIFKQVAQNFIQQEMLKLSRVVIGQAAMTGATVTGASIRTAAEVASAKTSATANSGNAIKSIMSSAASVFGKVYDAIAGIPYVGPFLAPVMAVAAAGAVVGYVSHVASAEGGYDIPAGINPMTQLHEKEMVLPAQQAQVIRDMADGGGGGAGGGTTINVNALDMRSIAQALRRNPNALGGAIRYAGRMGHLGTAS